MLRKTIPYKLPQLRYRLVLSVTISIFSVFGVFCAMSQTVEAASYYVDATGGADGNTGLLEGDAWQTISKVNSFNFEPGDNIYFNRGEIWREVLEVPSSGSNGSPITFGAYGTGEKPTIYGSDNLNGSWTQHSGDIYKIALATTPCGGYGCVVLNGTTNLTTNEGNFGTLALNETDWESEFLYVNIGGNPTGGNIEAGQRSRSFLISDKNYITVENLILRNGHNAGLDIDNACTGIVVNDVEAYSTGNDGFKQWNDSDVTYSNIISRYNLDDGISLHSDDGLTSTAVVNTGTFSNNDNGINNIATSEITLNSVTASDNTSSGVVMSGNGGMTTIDGGTFEDNTTTNLTFTQDQDANISDATLIGSTTGLSISDSSDVSVSGNTTITNATTGISVGTGSGNLTLSDNITITGATTGIFIASGGSGVYTISDTTITGGGTGMAFNANSGTNTLSNVTISGQSSRNMIFGAVTGTVTISNSSLTDATGNSIYNNGATITIENSEISNTTTHAIDVMSGSVLNLKNSVLYGVPAAKYGIIVRTGGSLTAINNVFYDNEGALYIQDPTVLYNNIFHTNTVAVTFGATSDTGDLTLSHNDFYNNGAIFANGDGSEENTNGLTSDPEFTDAPGYDFTIPSTSPVIDAGIDANVNTDRLGYNRYDAPNVANTGSVGSYTKDYVDMGAYEYMTSPTVSISSAVQKKNGSGSVDISVILDDVDDDNTLKAKVEYKAGATCSSGTSDPTLDETDENTTATHGDPKVENDNVYQIGNASGWVITSSGANTVLFDWLSATDVSAANGQYCIRITPNDGAGADGTAVTTTLTLDNVDPTGSDADITSQPQSGDTTVSVDGSFTETNPNTNQFYIALNGGSYGVVTNGQTNTADPIAVAVVTTALDGDDYVSKVKIVHTDDYGNAVTNENLSPSINYVVPLTPVAPTVNNATSSTVDVVVNENAGDEIDTVKYAINETTQVKYVQADGTLGASAVYQTIATWGTVTVTGLSAPVTDYVFRTIAMNPTDLSEATLSAWSSTASVTNTAPTVSIASTTEGTDGGNLVSIVYTIADPEADTQSLGTYEYSTDNVAWSTMTGGTGSEGTSGLTSTSGGASHIFVWNAGADLSDTEDPTVYVRLAANDGVDDGATDTSSAFVLDTASPSAIADFSANPASTSVSLTWTASSDGYFNHYEIWHGKIATDVDARSGTAEERDNSNDSDLATASTISASIGNLTPGATYYFKMWAVDDYGHETTSPGTISGTTNVLGGFFMNYLSTSSKSDAMETIEPKVAELEDTNPEAFVNSSSESGEFENLTVDSFTDLKNSFATDRQLEVIEFVVVNNLVRGEIVNDERVFSLDEYMNRAMAATIIARYLGCFGGGESTYSNLFNDVPDDVWFALSVGCLREKGIVVGKTSQNFAPEDSITKAEFLKMLIEAHMYKNSEIRDLWEKQMSSVGNVFVDVADNDWFLEYINFAYDQNFIEAYSEEEKLYSEANSFLTRIEGASLLYNFLNTE